MPDCSHSGVCTECGVCGDEFGENVVAEVPPLPVFQGHYEPEGRRTQRLRFRFTKDGKESFIGHLDTLRLLERACRRASLPVSMTRSPYSSRPRISTAMALPLGASSEAEMMEIVSFFFCSLSVCPYKLCVYSTGADGADEPRGRSGEARGGAPGGHAPDGG